MSDTKRSIVSDSDGRPAYIDHTTRSDVDGSVTRERYEALTSLGSTSEGSLVDVQTTDSSGQQWGCLSDGTPVEDRGSDGRDE